MSEIAPCESISDSIVYLSPVHYGPEVAMFEIMRKKKKNASKLPPLKSQEIPVTVGLLNATVSEIRSDIWKLREEMNLKFKEVDDRFVVMEARFDQKLESMETRFYQKLEERENRYDQKFEERFGRLEKLYLRQVTLVEEMRAERIFLLDGYASLASRMDRLEGQKP